MSERKSFVGTIHVNDYICNDNAFYCGCDDCCILCCPCDCHEYEDPDAPGDCEEHE